MNRILLTALLASILLSNPSGIFFGSAKYATAAESNTAEINAADQEPEKNDDAPAAPRPFSEAMQYLKPLGNVTGNLIAPFKQAKINTANYQQAIDYAERLNSYSLLVWHNGELMLERYFNGLNADLRSDTASMHKSVLALLVAAAIDDGCIKSVHDPVSKYLHEWQNQPKGDVTLINLLNMSSGLSELSAVGGMSSPSVQFFLDGNNARNTINALTLDSEPGSHFLYANTNSQILGMVLEAATKKPYQQYLSERLWRRIGADDAYVWNNEAGGFPRTYTALLARARDWLRVGLLFKNRGRVGNDQIIPSSLIDDIITSSTANPNYGWQVWLGREYQAKRYYNDKKTGPAFNAAEPFKAKDMVYFDGIGGQRVYISRANNLVIVRTGDMRFDWDDSQLPNLIMDALALSKKPT